MDQDTAVRIAEVFLGSAPIKRLGWGVSGYVYLSPDARTAVKVHRSTEGYQTELKAYRRLRRLRITQLLGLTVPKLRGFREDLQAIQMDFVSPPWLLDFAGVLFHPPDFSEDATASWHADVRTRFGSHDWMAWAVYNALAKHGIYYVDLRPSNINLKDLPGLEPAEEPNDEPY